jgi:ribose transport system substrate-binding protein
MSQRFSALSITLMIILLIVGLLIGYFAGTSMVRPSAVSTYTVSVPTTITAPTASAVPATVTLPTTVSIPTTYTLTTTISAPTTRTPIKIALLLMGAGNPYWDAWAQGVDDAVKLLNAYGIPASYTYFDGKYDPTIQYNQILSAIGAYNVIIITPVDRVGLQPAIKRAMDAGVVTIVADNAVEDDSLMRPFIGSNNLKAAELEALTLINALRESGKPTPWKIFVIHGVTTAANNVLRLMGFVNVLKPFIDNGTVKVVDVQCGYDTADKAYSATLTVLARTKIDAVLSTNDAQAIGVIRAVEASGLTPGKDVIVVGLDGIPEAIQAIKEGKMYATVAQAPYVMGFYSVFLAFYKIYFGFDPVQASGGKNWIVTPTPVVTKQNLDTYVYIVKGQYALPLPTENTASVKPVSDVTSLINTLKTG